MHDSADFGCICMMVYMHEMGGVYPYIGVYINEMGGVYGYIRDLYNWNRNFKKMCSTNVIYQKMACGATHIVFISFHNMSRKSNSIVTWTAYILDNPSFKRIVMLNHYDGMKLLNLQSLHTAESYRCVEDQTGKQIKLYNFYHILYQCCTLPCREECFIAPNARKNSGCILGGCIINNVF